MKKLKISIITFAIILCISKISSAANASVQLNGENKVIAGKDNTITLQIQNSEAIGVIEGTISHDSNIKDIQISPSYNGWTITYNESTGKFNAFKAEGTSNGEALQITYKLDENASQCSITLKDIELTTTSYNTIKIEKDIIKTITKTTEDNNQLTNNNNNNQNNANSSNNNNQANNQSNIATNNINTKRNNTNTTTKNQIVRNNVTKSIFPKAGSVSFIIVPILIVLIITTIMLYKKLQYYKSIK